MRSRLSERLSRLSETSLPERGVERGCCLIWCSFLFWMVGMWLIRLLHDGMMGWMYVYIYIYIYIWWGGAHMWWQVRVAWSYMNITWVVRYVCDHKLGMNKDEPWWLVILWHVIDLRGDVSSRLVIRAGTDWHVIYGVVYGCWYESSLHGVCDYFLADLWLLVCVSM